MRCVRIWFDKTGEVKYISHLDLMRCFTRAIRRAKIPLWFTEGYNPRPYMQFALPLSLGMESVCESVDIRIEGEMTDSEILEGLKKVMPDGITIKKITTPAVDPKYIASGEFEMRFSACDETEKLEKIISDAISGESLVVQKLGKQGRKKVLKDIDLLEHLKEIEFKKDGNDIICRLILPAGSATNVNPSLFSDKIIELYGKQLAVSIMRKRLLLADGTTFN